MASRDKKNFAPSYIRLGIKNRPPVEYLSHLVT